MEESRMKKNGNINATCVDRSADSVAAIIVTYKRNEFLKQGITALTTQTHSVSEIFVVDNTDGTATREMLSQHFPNVTYMNISSNVGPAGGFAAGMKAAYEAGHKWIWVFNDDAIPYPSNRQRMAQWAGS